MILVDQREAPLTCMAESRAKTCRQKGPQITSSGSLCESADGSRKGGGKNMEVVVLLCMCNSGNSFPCVLSIQYQSESSTLLSHP
jgi:hypothetical protein